MCIYWAVIQQSIINNRWSKSTTLTGSIKLWDLLPPGIPTSLLTLKVNPLKFRENSDHSFQSISNLLIAQNWINPISVASP